MNKEAIINDETFISRGYKHYSPGPFNNEGVVDCFQKRFNDDIGKKYFIVIEKWSWDFVPERKRDKWWKQYTYNFSCQLYKKDTHKAVDINFFSEWTIEEVEEHVEWLFQSGRFDYYERWDDN